MVLKSEQNKIIVISHLGYYIQRGWRLKEKHF